MALPFIRYLKTLSEDEIREQLQSLVKNNQTTDKRLNVDYYVKKLFDFRIYEGEELLYLLEGRTVEKNTIFANKSHSDRTNQLFAKVIKGLDFDGSDSYSRGFNPNEWDKPYIGPFPTTTLFFTNFRIILKTTMKDLNDRNRDFMMTKFYKEMRSMSVGAGGYYGDNVNFTQHNYEGKLTREWTEHVYYFPFYFKFKTEPCDLDFFDLNAGFDMRENYTRADEALQALISIFKNHPAIENPTLNDLIPSNRSSSPVAETQITVANTELSDDSINQLKQLHELKQAGILTDDEFNLKKKQILGL